MSMLWHHKFIGIDKYKEMGVKKNTLNKAKVRDPTWLEECSFKNELIQ